MPRSTVAPRLSELDMKQNFLIIVEMMVVVMKTIDDNGGGEYILWMSVCVLCKV